MNFRYRLTLWTSAAALVYTLDIGTKMSAYSDAIRNYTPTPAPALALAAAFLALLVAVRSSVIAVGAGIMFGALCANGGQLIVQGYVSDWLHVGPLVTNVADLAGACGLLLCLLGYAKSLRGPRVQTEKTANRTELIGE